MLIGVPQEIAVGEARVAATPETVKKLVAQGHTLRVQQGAGLNASVTDEAYTSNERLCWLVGPFDIHDP